ncbi:MAG: ATP-binding cassette domain-containing protein, partial [Tidjanibacter sp.]|nr:ATP-binding cassette domain-containing protein [Tidjanibacter sp.]
GIMGATGSGKSTIINLLQRFYDASEGAVKLDGFEFNFPSGISYRLASMSTPRRPRVRHRGLRGHQLFYGCSYLYLS